MSLKRNTLWNLAGTGLPLLLGAVTIPFLIHRVGIESFGVLTLIWALIGYFSLFDFGLGRALTQQVAAVRSAGDHAQLPSLVKTGLGFTAVTGVLGGLILACLASPMASHWLKVSAALQPSTLVSLLIAAVGIPLTTVTTGFRGILEAYEDFGAVNILRMGLGAANFGLPALSVLLLGNSLVWMVASLILARVIVLLAHAWVVHLRLPEGWLTAPFSRENMRRLLSFGAWMTVSNIISPLMVTADRFVISAVLGAGVVAYYTVPFEALIRVLVIPGALTAALFPRLTATLTSDRPTARRLYSNSLKLMLVVLLPICLVICAGSKFGLGLWLGKGFASHAWLTVSILAIGLLFNGIAAVPFAAVQATGNARPTAILHMTELVIYVPVLIGLLKLWGVPGAAMAWTFRVLIDLIALMVVARVFLRSDE
ncbi:flippase [Paraburkholderia phenazinium]|jgi:O-antigen/teichoic acid export membrane protein|uniref:Membrane protein involved in the export of O-antigen and teichoic acid n=1 Tax=Paraburkholderia phenazinium TaxID=60549 RepID=A0A1G8HY47_9BURK|nr:flippase [Paraburkholderia phenazinium]SDI11380.1 Membrane protein involved in the export of O-antigen and teichoic acid [Paraburkholderia phenazinium]